MRYTNQHGGRVGSDYSNAARNPSSGAFMSFAAVEERLVEATCLWHRAPDRERGWLHVRAYWPEVRRSEFIRVVAGELDWPEPETDLRPLPLTRAEVATMTEASEWLAHVPERDRRLVVAAVAYLAAGHPQVSWTKLKRRLGVPFGADGLRMRYSRAITAIADALNNAQKSAKIARQDG